MNFSCERHWIQDIPILMTAPFVDIIARLFWFLWNFVDIPDQRQYATSENVLRFQELAETIKFKKNEDEKNEKQR